MSLQKKQEYLKKTIYPFIDEMVDVFYTDNCNNLIESAVTSNTDKSVFLMFVVMYFGIHLKLEQENDLSKKEQIIICKILEEKLFNSIKVNPIYIELNNLTPELVLEDYSCLVMYNYVEWINNEKFKKSISNKKLKDILLYCPMLYNTEDIPIDETVSRSPTE